MSESFMSGEVFERAVQAAAEALEDAPFLDSTEALARRAVEAAAPVMLLRAQAAEMLLETMTCDMVDQKQRAERAEAEAAELHDDLHKRDVQYTNLALVAGRLAKVLRRCEDTCIDGFIAEQARDVLAAFEEAYPDADL